MPASPHRKPGRTPRRPEPSATPEIAAVVDVRDVVTRLDELLRRLVGEIHRHRAPACARAHPHARSGRRARARPDQPGRQRPRRDACGRRPDDLRQPAGRRGRDRGRRHRRRDPVEQPGRRVRAVLHDQARRAGHRPRAGDGPQLRRERGRPTVRPIGPRTRRDILDVASDRLADGRWWGRDEAGRSRPRWPSPRPGAAPGRSARRLSRRRAPARRRGRRAGTDTTGRGHGRPRRSRRSRRRSPAATDEIPSANSSWTQA